MTADIEKLKALALARDLLDEEGENLAVRAFLLYYGGGNAACPIISMRAHLARSGFDGCWPAWAAAPNSSTLTKAGAQLWIRHLFSLERAEKEASDSHVIPPPRGTGSQQDASSTALDAAMLDWLEQRITETGSVWILPSGPDMRFVQIRHAGHTTNYPTVGGTIREAIGAAIGAHAKAGKEPA